MGGNTATEWVETLIRSAAQLRAAGVEEIVAGDFRAVLRAPDVTADASARDSDRDSDPLNDPSSFAGGRIPVASLVDDVNPFADGDA